MHMSLRQQNTHVHSAGQIPGIYSPPHLWLPSLDSINSASWDADPQVKQQAHSIEQSEQTWWMTVAQYLDTSDKREPADPFLNNVDLHTHI